jgi:hypothetical protein
MDGNIPFVDSYSQEYQWARFSAEFTGDFNRQDPNSLWALVFQNKTIAWNLHVASDLDLASKNCTHRPTLGADTSVGITPLSVLGHLGSITLDSLTVFVPESAARTPGTEKMLSWTLVF